MDNHASQTLVEGISIAKGLSRSRHDCVSSLEPLMNHSPAYSTNSQHTFGFDSTQIDYLKKSILAYMTGTDPMVRESTIALV